MKGMSGPARAAATVRAALACCALCALCGCSEPEPVRIGFVGGLSGRVADLGISGRDGATLAVEERNRAGGVGGRRIELIVRSDEQDAETARRVVRELGGLGVVAIIGHMTSAMSVATVPVADELRIPLVSPTTTTTDLEGRDDHFLRVASTTREYTARMARYLRGARGLAAVSVIHDTGNRSFTESWIAHFTREFSALGGRVVRDLPFTSGQAVRFEELAREALAGGVDGVVLVASAMDTAMLAQQIRKLGSGVALASSEWASTEQLLELGGGAVEGMIVSQFFDRTCRLPGYLAFREAYRARFGQEPGFASVGGYDAASVVLEALARRRTGEGVRDAVLRISSFAALQGPLTIDRHGDADRPSRIAVVREGGFQVVDGQ